MGRANQYEVCSRPNPVKQLISGQLRRVPENQPECPRFTPDKKIEDGGEGQVFPRMKNQKVVAGVPANVPIEVVEDVIDVRGDTGRDCDRQRSDLPGGKRDGGAYGRRGDQM